MEGLGTPLQWAPFDHQNTDNGHVHLLVRERDRPAAGHRAQYIEAACAGTAGSWPHSGSDAARAAEARDQAVEQPPFTELDRALLRCADDHGLATYDKPRPSTLQGLRVRAAGAPPAGSPRGSRADRESRSLAAGGDDRSHLRQAQLAGGVPKLRARCLTDLSDGCCPGPHPARTRRQHRVGRLLGTGSADELRDHHNLYLRGRMDSMTSGSAPRTRSGITPRARRRRHRRHRPREDVGRSRHRGHADRMPAALAGLTGRPPDRRRPGPESGAPSHTRSSALPAATSRSHRRLAHSRGYARGEDRQRYAVIETDDRLVVVGIEYAPPALGPSVRQCARGRGRASASSRALALRRRRASTASRLVVRKPSALIDPADDGRRAGPGSAGGDAAAGTVLGPAVSRRGVTRSRPGAAHVIRSIRCLVAGRLGPCGGSACCAAGSSYRSRCSATAATQADSGLATEEEMRRRRVSRAQVAKRWALARNGRAAFRTSVVAGCSAPMIRSTSALSS